MAGTGMGLAIVILGRFAKASVIAGINLAFAGSLFIFLLASSGPHGYMGIWLFIYPLAVFFMLGVRTGTFFNAVFTAAAAVVLLFPDFFPSLVPVEKDFTISERSL
jgi:hypothetical protein